MKEDRSELLRRLVEDQLSRLDPSVALVMAGCTDRELRVSSSPFIEGKEKEKEKEKVGERKIEEEREGDGKNRREHENCWYCSSYCDRYGADYFSFWIDGAMFIVVNTALLQYLPTRTPKSQGTRESDRKNEIKHSAPTKDTHTRERALEREAVKHAEWLDDRVNEAKTVSRGCVLISRDSWFVTSHPFDIQRVSAEESGEAREKKREREKARGGNETEEKGIVPLELRRRFLPEFRRSRVLTLLGGNIGRNSRALWKAGDAGRKRNKEGQEREKERTKKEGKNEKEEGGENERESDSESDDDCGGADEEDVESFSTTPLGDIHQSTLKEPGFRIIRIFQNGSKTTFYRLRNAPLHVPLEDPDQN